MEEKSTFEKGDVVSLKSGGPHFTVEFVTSEGEVMCIWFNGNLKNRESFDQKLLMKIENDNEKIKNADDTIKSYNDDDSIGETTPIMGSPQ